MKLTSRVNRIRRSNLCTKRSRLCLEILEPRLNLALVVPAFSSLPGANHTIYLDFDGHVTTGTSWNNGATINSPAYNIAGDDPANFSAAELNVIERTFQRVAEDFAPFQVNVTTAAPAIADLIKSGTGDTKWGVRVVVTTDVAFNCGCGGIAYIDSFNWNSDTPVFVFNTSEIGVAEAASHEVGHSLGLSHDGTSSTSYYQGHGLGSDTAYWSSIMGVGYYVDVSHWDRGEYFGTNNGSASANYNKGPDDIGIITSYNGFGYKADDHGNNSLTATPLTVSGSALTGSGLISTRSDSDYFSFTTGGGSITLNVNPAAIGANLDIEASLFDSNNVLVATSNPMMSLNATVSANLSAGQYFLKIDGVGAGNPTVSPPTGYTDYDSLGQYTINGTVAVVTGDTLSIVPTDASKNEGNLGSTLFTFMVNRTGNTSGTSTVDYVITGAGVSPASAADFVGGVFPATGSLTFAPGVTSQPITVNVLGETVFESNETFSVSLSNPSTSTSIGTGAATGTIFNDDASPAPPTLSISATDASKAEGTGSASTPFVFTVTRSGNLSAASSVRYTVTGTGSKKASNNDIAGGFVSNVLVNFPAGTSSVDITVSVRADSNRESNETFRVTLASATGATIATAFANGTIINDDGTGAAAEPELDDIGTYAMPELIAVADPLWMFMPPERLSAGELAVPVVTWIAGVPHVGDLAHDFEHHAHELEIDDNFFEDGNAATANAAPFNFDTAANRLSAVLSAGRTLPSQSSEAVFGSSRPLESLTALEKSPLAAKPDTLVFKSSRSANKAQAASSNSKSFEAIDTALSEGFDSECESS